MFHPAPEAGAQRASPTCSTWHPKLEPNGLPSVAQGRPSFTRATLGGMPHGKSANPPFQRSPRLPQQRSRSRSLRHRRLSKRNHRPPSSRHLLPFIKPPALPMFWLPPDIPRIPSTLNPSPPHISTWQTHPVPYHNRIIIVMHTRTNSLTPLATHVGSAAVFVHVALHRLTAIRQ